MPTRHNARLPLSFIAPGTEVRLCHIDEAIDPIQHEQLLAYGLTPSCRLRILQQRPMTLILADQIELALEHGIARHLWVEPEIPATGA